MVDESRRVLHEVYESVLNCDKELACRTVKRALDSGIDALTIIEEGLVKGIREVGDRYSRGEYFLTELIMSGEAMGAAMELVKLAVPEAEVKVSGKILIGTVAGDIHDLGKRIVSAILRGNGFEVSDLGVDVPSERFLEKAKELEPQVVGMSVLMPTSKPEMKKIIDALSREGLRNAIKVIVGGGPVTQAYANEIGADAYGVDAIDGLEKVKKLIGL